MGDLGLALLSSLAASAPSLPLPARVKAVTNLAAALTAPGVPQFNHAWCKAGSCFAEARSVWVEALQAFVINTAQEVRWGRFASGLQRCAGQGAFGGGIDPVPDTPYCHCPSPCTPPA